MSSYSILTKLAVIFCFVYSSTLVEVVEAANANTRLLLTRVATGGTSGANGKDTIGDDDAGKFGEIYLPKHYNKLELPKPDIDGMDELDIQVPVLVHINIPHIIDIDETDQVLTLEIDFIVEWLDGSLFSKNNKMEKLVSIEDEEIIQAPLKPLDPTFLEKIWKPDIFLEGLQSATHSNLMGSPSRLLFSNTGRIIFSSKFMVKLNCNFDFQFYPADTQKCDVALGSYSYNTTDIKLTWRKPIGVFLYEVDDDNFDLSIDDVRRSNFVAMLGEDNRKNESFTGLGFTIMMRRRLSYHILQTYIPSGIYLAITWLCFMIPTRLAEGRIAIAMTTLLTLTSMFASIRESTPVVSYVKAIDIWMVACISFVFFTLLEFAILLWSGTSDEEELRKQYAVELQKKSRPSSAGQENIEQDVDDENLITHELHKAKKQLKSNVHFVTEQYQHVGQEIRDSVFKRAIRVMLFIEKFSFIFVFFILVTFASVYWSWLIINSRYLDWKVNSVHNDLDRMVTGQTVVELDPFE